MSHIDSYDHEYIGRFLYLPVYHPTDTSEASWGDEDFGFSPANLVLGGGSGEHPGLVVHRLDACVARFLIDSLSDSDYEKLSEDDRYYLNELSLLPYQQILEYCGWYTSHFARFHEAVNSPTCFGPREDEHIEDWLMSNIGELVYFALLELNPEQKRMKEMVAPFRVEAVHTNVLCVPPGYPPEGGRKVVNNEVIWGNHRW